MVVNGGASALLPGGSTGAGDGVLGPLGAMGSGGQKPLHRIHVEGAWARGGLTGIDHLGIGRLSFDERSGDLRPVMTR
jgi:hypothetical protein